MIWLAQVLFSVFSLLTVSDGSKKLPADQISVTSSGSSGSEMEDLSSPNSACSIRLQVNSCVCVYVCACVSLMVSQPCILYLPCPQLCKQRRLCWKPCRAFICRALSSAQHPLFTPHKQSSCFLSHQTHPEAFVIPSIKHWMALKSWKLT